MDNATPIAEITIKTYAGSKVEVCGNFSNDADPINHISAVHAHIQSIADHTGLHPAKILTAVMIMFRAAEANPDIYNKRSYTVIVPKTMTKREGSPDET